MRQLIILTAFAVMISTAALGAERVKVHATLSADQIYVGDSAMLRISVSGTTDSSIRPRVPDVEGISVSSTGSPTVTTMIINNVTSRELVFNYRITARKTGQFEIPAFEILVGGINYKTTPLNISVIDISRTDKMFIETQISPRTSYVLSPVTVTYDLFLAPKVESRGLNFPIASDGERMGLYRLSTVPQNEEVRIGRTEYHCGVYQKSRDGVAYKVYSFKFHFYPTFPGEYVIDPPVATGAILKGTRIGRDSWGFRTRVPEYEEVRAIGQSVTLTVKSVPDEGKPEGYTGAVGRYSISVTADRTKVKVGDPIELKIEVKGWGLLEKIQRPDLSVNKEFSDNFKISETLQPGEQTGDNIVFTQVIRPKTTELTEIPPIHLPYFDTRSGKYEIAESRPIPLEVLETSVVTADEVIRTEGLDGMAGLSKTKVEGKAGGINAIYFHSGALVDQRVDLKYLWFLVIPVMGYVAAAAVVTKRRRLTDDLAFARARRARRVVKERLSEARRLLPNGGCAFYEALWKGVDGYISDKLNLGEGELTALDLEQLRGRSLVGDEFLEEISELLAACDEGRFGSDNLAPQDKENLLNRSEDLISRLEKELSR
jgi:hypothetical protein